MSGLADRIRSDMTEAMKAQERDRTSVLRMLQSSIKYAQIEAGHPLSDDEALAVIRKAVKQRQDSIDQYTSANRTDLAEKERSEMELLKQYLPPELSDAEIESGIREIIVSTGAQSKKDMGKVMKEATARYRGRVDGRRISEMVGRLLP